MSRARLLQDARETLKLTAAGLADAPLLPRALSGWLTGHAAPAELLSRLSAAPPPRSYEWVALACLAEAASWPVDARLIDDGLQWLSGVSLDRVGMPAPVSTDCIAQLALAVAIRQRRQLEPWLRRVLGYAPDRREPAWARGGASFILGGSENTPIEQSLRLVLAELGLGESAQSDIDEVLDALVRVELPTDPLHAMILLKALDLIYLRAERRRARTRVFVSYSRKDTHWLERLQVHLAPLERDGLIDRWDDSRIEAGQLWREEIESALRNAGAAVVLVSADFLASSFILDVELPALLARAEKSEVRILPVIISHCLFDRSSLARFLSVNRPDRPLIALSAAEQESVLVDTARAVIAAVGDEVVRSRPAR